MAGDWIKMRSDLFTHPKVVRMSSALKADGRPALLADRMRTVGGLMAVWCLFDAHSTDGRLASYSLEAIDEQVGMPGFGHAMAAVEWIAEDATGLVLPEFDKHNGQSAKRRAQEADRKREARKSSATDADKVRTREEKRREEKERGATTSAPTLELVSDDQGQGGKAAAKRGTRLSDNWQPSGEDFAWARKERPDVDLRTETASFCDYWRAKPGKEGTKLDWTATWRNWIRNSRKAGGVYNQRPEQPRARQELTR